MLGGKGGWTVTLAACLFGSWAVGSATHLWPGLLSRLSLSWPFATAAALLVPLTADWTGPFGWSVGTVLWPAALGIALWTRLGVDARRRTLEAALLSGLVLVLARALGQSPTSVPAAIVAGLCAAVLAPGERAATAAALCGVTLVPALLRTAASAAASATGAADDLACALVAALGTSALSAAAAPALGSIIRRDRG